MHDYYPEKVFQHCPQCSSKNFTRRDDSSFQCQDCSFVFYINQAAAVIAIIEDAEGKLLLTTRAKDPCKGMLDLPGGFVDIGETLEEALVREIKEELGLDIVQHHYLFSLPNRYLYGGIVYFTLDAVFLCKVDDFSTLKMQDEITDIHFISPSEINLADVGLESMKQTLRQHYHLS